VAIASGPERRLLAVGAAAFALALACATTPEQQQLMRALEKGLTIAEAAAQNYAPEHAERVQKAMAFLQSRMDAQGETTTRGVVATPLPATDELALEIALLKRVERGDGSVALAPLADGDVLVDGAGSPQAGDRFGILVSLPSPAHLYVIAADATGWIQPLYPPRLAATSPLAAGTRVFLPSDGQWYALDQNRGAESFYFVASKARLPALEEVLSPFEAGQRPPMLRAQAEPVGEPTEIANGVRTRQPTEAAGPGGEGTLAAQAFLAEPGAGAIVVTRWLLHR
jgi:hypothetical protein